MIASGKVTRAGDVTDVTDVADEPPGDYQVEPSEVLAEMRAKDR